MNNKIKYKVFCYEGKATWREIIPFDKEFWEGEDIGEVFNKSVMENGQENLRSTSYQILQYDGGAVLNITINIDSNKE